MDAKPTFVPRTARGSIAFKLGTVEEAKPLLWKAPPDRLPVVKPTNSFRFLIVSAVCAASLVAQSSPSFLPLKKGTTWLYSGTVGLQGAGGQPHEIQMSWKAEILDSVEEGRTIAVLLRGDPRDLIGYSGAPKRGCYLVITVEDRELYFLGWDSCALPRGELSHLQVRDNLLLKMPAQKGDFYGDRPDGRYEWFVDDRQPADLARIKGIPVGRDYVEYTLSYSTNPDHQIAKFVPGVGLTSYSYSHHGTVSEVHMKLVEMQDQAIR